MTIINPNPKVGLSVMRLSPLHGGHCSVINTMIQECETAIVCIGSSQEKRTNHNPYTVEERMEMLRNVYGDRIKIIPLKDIGAANPQQWVDYIFDKITKLGMAEPTDYYTGSVQDSIWYENHFYHKNPHGGDGRLLHILGRDKNVYPPATEIRGYLELRDNGWKQWIPRVNHIIVGDNYPEELKIPLD